MLLTQNNHLYQPPSILTCAHSLVPIEVMTLDFAIRAFQASQQASRIASYVSQTQLLRALPRRYSQMFSAVRGVGRQWQEHDVLRHDDLRRTVPAGSVEDQQSDGARADASADFSQV